MNSVVMELKPANDRDLWIICFQPVQRWVWASMEFLQQKNLTIVIRRYIYNLHAVVDHTPCLLESLLGDGEGCKEIATMPALQPPGLETGDLKLKAYVGTSQTAFSPTSKCLSWWQHIFYRLCYQSCNTKQLRYSVLACRPQPDKNMILNHDDSITHKVLKDMCDFLHCTRQANAWPLLVWVATFFMLSPLMAWS